MAEQQRLKQRDREEWKRERALLVSVYLRPASEQEALEHLDELELLCDTYGLTVLKKMPIPVRSYSASTFMTKGKLAELKEAITEAGADCVVIDEEITASQQRNLEEELCVTVLDRTEVIIEVFTQRAQTKEARLQVELAKLNYLTPRLKRLWTHLSRQSGTAGGGGSGGGGYLKGVGEKQIELDRRLIKKRITRLKEELEEVFKNRRLQRKNRQRNAVPTFAIIGYTNTGKSTLLKRLTDAEVLVEDKLFATLDTTSRQYILPNNQKIILIDTVGFIRKLPHQLVAAFKSTLEEALYADILIHVVDASNPCAVDQAETSLDLLRELGVHDKPIVTLLNKADVVEDQGMVLKLKLKNPKTVLVSALTGDGFDELLEKISEELSNLRRILRLRIPQSEYRCVSEITERGRIIEREYDGNDILLEVEVPVRLAEALSKYEVE